MLSAQQVDAVLARQRELAAAGRRARFGEIAIELGLVSAAQVQVAVDRQQLERT